MVARTLFRGQDDRCRRPVILGKLHLQLLSFRGPHPEPPYDLTDDVWAQHAGSISTKFLFFSLSVAAVIGTRKSGRTSLDMTFVPNDGRQIGHRFA
jgi:hypothetical protein